MARDGSWYERVEFSGGATREGTEGSTVLGPAVPLALTCRPSFEASWISWPLVVSARPGMTVAEVRSLLATRGITGAPVVDESGKTLEEIVIGVKKVGDIIAEIAAASSEQSAGIEQVNRAVTSMDEVTQQNAALAEQTSAASASMSDKAREMARVVRREAPGAEIILGGHGAAIEDVELDIDCDHVVKGEGIGWMRRHLGQDPDAPIRHPALPSTERTSILGVPLLDTPANLLVPGVGCVNGCSFCSTSHFFGRSYTPFLATGDELFETACRVAD